MKLRIILSSILLSFATTAQELRGYPFMLKNGKLDIIDSVNANISMNGKTKTVYYEDKSKEGAIYYGSFNEKNGKITNFEQTDIRIDRFLRPYFKTKEINYDNKGRIKSKARCEANWDWWDSGNRLGYKIDCKVATQTLCKKIRDSKFYNRYKNNNKKINMCRKLSDELFKDIKKFNNIVNSDEVLKEVKQFTDNISRKSKFWMKDGIKYYEKKIGKPVYFPKLEGLRGDDKYSFIRIDKNIDQVELPRNMNDYKSVPLVYNIFGYDNYFPDKIRQIEESCSELYISNSEKSSAESKKGKEVKSILK